MILVVGISPRSLGISLCFRDRVRWYWVNGDFSQITGDFSVFHRFIVASQTLQGNI